MPVLNKGRDQSTGSEESPGPGAWRIDRAGAEDCNHLSVLTGVSFGLTSGVITTLGLMVGIKAGTDSQVVVLGGILTIAIADAFSDALGIHVSEEVRHSRSHTGVWLATLATFFSKLLFASSFAIPVLLLPLQTAVTVSIIWGLIVIVLASLLMARRSGTRAWKVVLEHVAITLLVVVITYFTGTLIRQFM